MARNGRVGVIMEIIPVLRLSGFWVFLGDFLKERMKGKMKEMKLSAVQLHCWYLLR